MSVMDYGSVLHVILRRIVVRMHETAYRCKKIPRARLKSVLKALRVSVWRRFDVGAPAECNLRGGFPERRLRLFICSLSRVCTCVLFRFSDARNLRHRFLQHRVTFQQSGKMPVITCTRFAHRIHVAVFEV